MNAINLARGPGTGGPRLSNARPEASLPRQSELEAPPRRLPVLPALLLIAALSATLWSLIIAALVALF